MLNQVIYVGRLVDRPEIKRTANNKEYTEIVVAVPRPFKNEEGVYDTDFIPCTLHNDIARNTAEYCRKGDIIGIRGRLQTENKRISVMADKVTFLSSNNSTKDDLSEGEV